MRSIGADLAFPLNGINHSFQHSSRQRSEFTSKIINLPKTTTMKIFDTLLFISCAFSDILRDF